MRPILLASALVASLALVPAAGALVGSCQDGNATTATGLAWVPGCLRVLSGDVVTFGSVDVPLHNARSSQDDLFLLRALAPACFATPNFGEGGSAKVRFFHDSGGVSASLQRPDGSWAPAVDCELAVDPVRSTATEASIPFECGIHPSMTGRIVVAQIGGGTG